MMRKTIFLLLVFVCANAAAEEWLCIADLFAGFTFEKGKWKAASGTHRQKYVLGMATEMKSGRRSFSRKTRRYG